MFNCFLLLHFILVMSIPVQVAASMFAPQPVRATQHPSFLDRRRSSTLNKDMYLASMRRPSATPSVISNFFQGWSTNTSTKEPYLQRNDNNDARRNSSISAASISTTESDASYSSALSSGLVHPTQPIFDRPHHPTPAHQRRLSMAQQSQDEDDVEDEALHPKRSHRADSVQIGNHINDLLKNEDVKDAVEILKEAICTMKMTDLHQDHDNEQVVNTYSTMLCTLCEPKMARIITEISGIDLENNPDAVYDTIIWKMFAKVVEAGYTLEVWRTCFYFVCDSSARELILVDQSTRRLLM